MANPLDSVLEWYEFALDSIRVTTRIARLGSSVFAADPAAPTVPPPTVSDWAINARRKRLFGLDPGVATASLQAAEDRLASLVVLELVAVFERVLRDHLTTRAESQILTDPVLRDAFREAVAADIEWWKVGERLIDVFVGVDSGLRGEVKQVVEFRNWVAHGWHTQRPPRKRVPSFIPVQEAYDRLTKFLKAAGLA